MKRWRERDSGSGRGGEEILKDRSAERAGPGRD